ncbi:ubiquinone biosynthesis protein COQ7-domain-containing protein [Zychaea mexicana]|uniref:ubiquinone biosynthesis protein COQ7-domain-containing protein n=1 Tax=Zychaea mexicana TaxID=64656 RepID=UPI0022FE5D39|nr:ubiquinone biosynthesis protein COQ7-domain-containing protein [Zychaea mexicana]KAI9496874.1 ubiquinone biosynthesis protein COQ7-domain-containing protein [Zychaea mexicana]
MSRAFYRLRSTALTVHKSNFSNNGRTFSTSIQQQQQQPKQQQQPLTDNERHILDPMLRVDQSGEVGAYYIYMGQIAVLGRDKKLRPILQEMWDQEKNHLETFDRLVGDMRIRPSLLRPLWEVAGFAVGAGTALMGKEAAMACTEAVETVIGNHYDDQLRDLVKLTDQNPELKDLGKTIAQFRDEELEHHDIAVAHDAQEAPFHSALKAVIMQGCKTAIWVAERV